GEQMAEIGGKAGHGVSLVSAQRSVDCPTKTAARSSLSPAAGGGWGGGGGGARPRGSELCGKFSAKPHRPLNPSFSPPAGKKESRAVPARNQARHDEPVSRRVGV